MLRGRDSSRRRWALRSALLLPALVGCSAIQFGADPTPDLNGTWTGTVEIQGERLEGSLTIEQEGSRLAAAFTAPAAELVAEGEGEVTRGGEAWIDFTYDVECPGTARFEGRLEEEDHSVFSGSVEAQDCTGVARGTFAFRR